MSARRRLLLILIPLSALGLLAVLAKLGNLATYYRAMAEEHAAAEAEYRALAARASPRFDPTREQAASIEATLAEAGIAADVRPDATARARALCLASADWHATLRAKYEAAARRPWLPVAPDPPGPE